jgi:hypothetical protein
MDIGLGRCLRKSHLAQQAIQLQGHVSDRERTDEQAISTAFVLTHDRGQGVSNIPAHTVYEQAIHECARPRRKTDSIQ